MRIVTGLLFIMLFGLGVIFLGKQTVQVVVPASFLPSNTIIYAEQQNGVEAIEQFRNSRMGKALATINFVQVLQNVETNPAYVEIVEKSLATINKLMDDRLVHEIIGSQCSVALFPRRPWSANAGSIEGFIEDHLLLISKPRMTEAALDVLTSYYTADIKMNVVPYGEYSIKRFQVNDKTISVVFTEGFALASLEERVLREALDLHDTPSKTLMSKPDFHDHTEELGNADRLLYLSIEGLQDLAKYGASRAETAREQGVLTEFSSLKGVTSITYASWRNSLTIQNKLFVTLNRQTMDPLVREMIATPPSLNDTLPFIAQDSLLYYWSNTLNVRLLWEMYVSEAGEDDGHVMVLRKTIQDISGHALEDLLEMINSNVSILLKKSARTQFVPIPDFALLVKLNNPENIGEILKKSLLDLDINIQSRKYKDIQYYYWGLYPQESLQPVYSIHRGYLIIANTLDILKTIIDTPMNDSRLVAASDFSDLDPGFQKLNNSVFYVDQATLVYHLGELFSWTGTMLAIQDRHAAEQSKILIDELISPLFLGVAMYEKTATRTFMEDNRIVIESKTRIRQVVKQ